MGEEPTNGELGRRLDTIQLTLSGLISRPEYAADLRTTEHRITELMADVEDARRQHAEDVRALHERIGEAAKEAREQRLSWRTVLWTGLLPGVLVLVSVLVQVMLAHQGGR